MSKSVESSSFIQNVYEGSVSALSAIPFIQPLIYFKNIQQSTALVKHYGKDPRVWYRGVRGFALSFVPTTALQTQANGIFSNIFGPTVAAPVAGVVSSFVVCPAEAIMVQQQKTGQSYQNTAKQIYVNYGLQGFYRGLVPTAAREGVFTAAYLEGSTKLKEHLQKRYGMNEWSARVVAGLVVATVAATISQPLDTFKTQQQQDYSRQMSLLKGVCQKNALAGLEWRILMVAVATIVMPYTKEKLKT